MQARRSFLSQSPIAMLPDQRRNTILQITEQQGFVTMQQIVDQVGVSESTVRRDLEHLEKICQIRRTRGGASYVGESLTPFDERFMRAFPEKQSVGRAAAALVQPGEAVLLDGGTTTLEVARHLVGKSLQVVTNSVPIVNLLANQPQIELIFLGGYVYPKTGVALGPLTMAALAEIHVRRLFVSVGGITERGLFNSNALLVETELGHSALANLCPLEKVHRVVVDSGISPEWRQVLRDAGIIVDIVEMEVQSVETDPA